MYILVSLADVRACRNEARKLLANSIDPGDKKKNDKVELEDARTFEELAVEWDATNKKWPEERNRRELGSLEDNLFPAIGKRNVAELKALGLLAPIKAVELFGQL